MRPWGLAVRGFLVKETNFRPVGPQFECGDPYPGPSGRAIGMAGPLGRRSKTGFLWNLKSPFLLKHSQFIRHLFWLGLADVPAFDDLAMLEAKDVHDGNCHRHGWHLNA